MELIKDKEYGGERPLYCTHDLQLDGVTIHIGESSLKETHDITAHNCRFEGKYVFWECTHFLTQDCYYAPSARSSLWYSHDGTLRNCQVDAPKMFRRMDGITIDNCQFTDAQETLWDCSDIKINDSTFQNADYLGMYDRNVRLENFHIDGNYSFQYGKNIEIHNSVLNSKDALWEAKDITIFDSEINGEYLAWYAENIRFVRCHITGEQPLCYVKNLTLEDCTFGSDANLAFEYSTINATILGDITSIKNPTSGHIHVSGHIGEIILDQNQKSPADCVIKEG